MHLDPTIRTTPSLIEDEAHLFSHLDQISGAMLSRGINVNVPFVEPWSQAKSGATCSRI
jgi:hypothetical protein